MALSDRPVQSLCPHPRQAVGVDQPWPGQVLREQAAPLGVQLKQLVLSGVPSSAQIPGVKVSRLLAHNMVEALWDTCFDWWLLRLLTGSCFKVS